MSCPVERHMHSDPSICLVCGQLACFLCFGCRAFEDTQGLGLLPSSSGSNIATSTGTAGGGEYGVFGMQAHMRRCHAGYGLLLRIYKCRVVMLSEQARRVTELQAPYRDQFGEADPQLR
ncbi:unnamed protein product [Protopolystoma xenopodis]|uniref:E3 ubiquitin-protein ligase n=1 Tax=Protopolystoma xenopodis TaxID=117903 RepID=A0A3S5B5A5_9PLAT|nr:unnamed protein product [Protopolystoma xenopodis]